MTYLDICSDFLWRLGSVLDSAKTTADQAAKIAHQESDFAHPQSEFAVNFTSPFLVNPNQLWEWEERGVLPTLDQIVRLVKLLGIDSPNTQPGSEWKLV